MKILVIADIHHKVNIASSILYKENYDKCIFTGDYLDDFNDTVEFAAQTAKWLKNSLEDPRHIHLKGNHDLAYEFPANRNCQCSGYSIEKQRVISKILSKEDWAKLKWFHYEKEINCLFTHAGLTKSLASDNIANDPNLIIYNLNKESFLANKAASRLQNHWFYQVGYMRGGFNHTGGFIWCDWREFTPIEGLNQIFGHTPRNEVVDFNKGFCKEFDASERFNINCDTHLRQYLVIDNGKIKVENI